MNQEQKLNKIQNQYIQDILDKEELIEVRSEIKRLQKEKEKITVQLRELKIRLSNFKMKRYSTNISLNFTPRTEIFKKE